MVERIDQSLDRLLLQYASVYVRVDDPMRCVLPVSLRKPEPILLEIGRGLAIPIPDLKIAQVGFSATLSFRGRPFWVSVPWTAVGALLPVGPAVVAKAPSAGGKVVSLCEYRKRRGR